MDELLTLPLCLAAVINSIVLYHAIKTQKAVSWRSGTTFM